MSMNKGSLEDLRIDRSRAPRPLPWGRIVLAGFILLVIAAALLFWRNHKAPALVRTVAAVESSGASLRLTVLNASGYVTARRQATVSSKVTGQITEVLFEEGQKVEAGQILARIDPSNINTSLHLTEAQLESARVALDETKVQFEQSQRELKRFLALAETHISSQSEVDKAQSDSDVLQARLARQKADVTVAEKQVAYWQQQAEDTVIRAPFAGIVVSKTAQPGEIISPMSAGGAFTRTGICTLVDMASLEIEVDVNENYINRVIPEQPVQAVLDAYSDWKIPAKVIAIIPTADRQKATVKVRVGFAKLDPRILPDMGVKVAFQGGGELAPGGASSVTIPRAAVRNDGGRDIIWVVKDAKVERRAVKIGQEQNGGVPVLSNLTGGEKVVLEGAEGLKDGDAVQEKKS